MIKNIKRVTRISLTAIIIILLVGISINFTLRNSEGMLKEIKIIKKMSESTQVSDLQTQINQLNVSQTEYANYVQSCKSAIATAITKEGVTTSEKDTFEVMASNIGEILQARTKDATATAEDIAEGKTAWVKGKEITGTKQGGNSNMTFDGYFINYLTCSDVRIFDKGFSMTGSYSSINWTNGYLQFYGGCGTTPNGTYAHTYTSSRILFIEDCKGKKLNLTCGSNNTPTIKITANDGTVLYSGYSENISIDLQNNYKYFNISVSQTSWTASGGTQHPYYTNIYTMYLSN